MDFQKLKDKYAVHHINLEYCPTIADAKVRVQEMIQDDQVVGIGGSTTLECVGHRR
jgi:hypothetical protein